MVAIGTLDTFCMVPVMYIELVLYFYFSEVKHYVRGKGRVGFQKLHFFILKNKVKIWTVWPFHSCIPESSPAGRLEAPPPVPAGSSRLVTRLHLTFVRGWHYLLLQRIIFLFQTGSLRFFYFSFLLFQSQLFVTSPRKLENKCLPLIVLSCVRQTLFLCRVPSRRPTGGHAAAEHGARG